MRLKIVLASVALLFSSAALADQCQSWIHKGQPVSSQACSYSNGGSGYYVIENNGRSAAKVCWTVHTNNGKSLDGCNNNLGAGKSTRGSCSSCGSKNGGARSITLRSYEPKK